MAPKKKNCGYVKPKRKKGESEKDYVERCKAAYNDHLDAMAEDVNGGSQEPVLDLLPDASGTHT
jgi:hypothetical protein